MAKTQKSVRLSDLAIQQLNYLTSNFNMSEAEVIQMALNDLFNSETARNIKDFLALTKETIEEELRKLRELADGDLVEHPDTQFSDYPKNAS